MNSLFSSGARVTFLSCVVLGLAALGGCEKKAETKEEPAEDPKSPKKTKRDKTPEKPVEEPKKADEPPKKAEEPAKPTAGTTLSTGAFAGKYEASITNSEGKVNTANLDVSQIGGGMYNITYTIADNKLKGVCLGANEAVVCGMQLKQTGEPHASVMQYRRNDDGSLLGDWFEQGHTSLGIENLSGPGTGYTGHRKVTVGKHDGKTYTGDVTITKLAGAAHNVKWNVGSHYVGVGVEGYGRLAVAYTAGENFDPSIMLTAFTFEPKGGNDSFEGKYASSIGKEFKAGTLTLKRTK